MGTLKKYYFGCSKCSFNKYGYDPDFANVLKRACQLKITLPNLTERTVINQLFLDLKSSGVWAKQDYILNFAYNNTALASFGLINWKNPSMALATVLGTTTYTVNGFRGNSTDGGIITPFIPTAHGVNYTLNNAGRGTILYAEGTTSVTTRLIDFNAQGCRFTNNNSVNHRINSGNVNLGSSINITGIGYKGIFRVSSTTVELYNKNVKSTATSNSTSLDTSFFRLLSIANNNSGDVGMSFYHIGGALTETEKESLRTVYNTYMTGMGLSPIA